MNPNGPPTPNNELTGIVDYQVTIPLVRAPAGPDSTHEGQLRMRIPAATGTAAVMLGEHVAQHLAGALADQDPASAWAVAAGHVHAEKVNTPTVDELIAEAGHWKRIVTAMARKLPGMVQMTSEEYGAADPDDLVAQPTGPDTMTFLTPTFYAKLAAGLAATQQQQPGAGS